MGRLCGPGIVDRLGAAVRVRDRGGLAPVGAGGLRGGRLVRPRARRLARTRRTRAAVVVAAGVDVRVELVGLAEMVLVLAGPLLCGPPAVLGLGRRATGLGLLSAGVGTCRSGLCRGTTGMSVAFLHAGRRSCAAL